MRSEYHLSPADVARLIYDGPRGGRLMLRDRCLLKTLAHTGARRFEVAALDVRDIDLGARRAIIREGKGGKTRVVPLTAELASDLGLLIGRRKTGPVFASDLRRPISVRQVSRIVSEAGTRSGVVNPDPTSGGYVACHLLRHTFARRWKDSGGPIETLSRILGHASTATTLDLYGTKSVDDVCADYDALSASMYGG